MDESSFEKLEKELEKLAEASRQLGIMVCDFQPQAQTELNNKIKLLANCLKDIDSMKDSFKDVYVPMEVFDYIDDGKNPLLYTKDCLMKTLKKNEEIKGKIVTIRSFRDLLMSEMGKSFPEEYEVYTGLREVNDQNNVKTEKK